METLVQRKFFLTVTKVSYNAILRPSTHFLINEKINNFFLLLIALISQSLFSEYEFQ